MGTDDSEEFADERERMVTEQLEARGITDVRVLAAMTRVPRHLFVPERLREAAYQDKALPLGGADQTISQPYVVAVMLQALMLRPEDRVLEIGTGSGYEAAVLSQLVREVFSIDLDPQLVENARGILDSLGMKNVRLKSGDGFQGYSECAPFDKIVVSAAPNEIPRELVAQLTEAGKMILPFGEDAQVLVLLEKTPDGLKSTELDEVRFVPMKEGS